MPSMLYEVVCKTERGEDGIVGVETVRYWMIICSEINCYLLVSEQFLITL